jgi:hypothetical protein
MAVEAQFTFVLWTYIIEKLCFLLWEEEMYFPLIFLLNATKHLSEYKESKHKNTQKEAQKKVDQRGPSRPMEWHGGGFLVFSVCLTYSRLGVKKITTK